MNIISNCCIVGDLCEIKNIQYFTPFVWNTFFPNDIKILIKEYNNINFQNIELIKYKDTKYYGLNIDNKLSVYYIHYLYADHELRRDNDFKEVTGKNIEDYIIQSYKRRLARLNTNETPKFLFITNREAHANILGREETQSEWQEIIELIKSEGYSGIVFTKFDGLVGNDAVSVVKIANDNPRITLKENTQMIDSFIEWKG